jgi:hypothetical protein
VHDWQDHTHGEITTIAFRLSTSFDDLSARCRADFFRYDGGNPCEERGNKYNTSFGISSTVALGEYMHIEHLFRCARPSHYRPVVEALAWVNIPIRQWPQEATDRRYTANLKLYLNTSGVPN